MCVHGNGQVSLTPTAPAPLPSAPPAPAQRTSCLKGQKGHPCVCGQHDTSHSELQHPLCPCPAHPVSPVGGPGRTRGSAGSCLPGFPTWQAPALGGPCSFCQVLALAERGEPGMGVAGVQAPGTYCPLARDASWELVPSPSHDTLACSNTAEHLPPQCPMRDRGRGCQDAGEGVRDSDAGDSPEGAEPCQEQHPAWRNPSVDESPLQGTDGTQLSLAWWNPARPSCLCTVQPWLSHCHSSQSLLIERKQDLSQLTETTWDECSSHGPGFPRHNHLPNTKSLIMCAGEYVLTSSWLPHTGSATTTRWL